LTRNTSQYREKLCNSSNSGAYVRCVILHTARFPFLILLRSRAGNPGIASSSLLSRLTNVHHAPRSVVVADNA
jgi:hypothetical protein